MCVLNIPAEYRPIPDDVATGDYVIEVFCGTAEEPVSEATVLGISVLGQPSPTTTVAPVAPVVPVAQPAAAVATTPAFTG